MICAKLDSDYPTSTCENLVYHFHGTIQTIITSYLRPVNYSSQLRPRCDLTDNDSDSSGSGYSKSDVRLHVNKSMFVFYGFEFKLYFALVTIMYTASKNLSFMKYKCNSIKNVT